MLSRRKFLRKGRTEMESKSLRTIQGLSKAGQVISKIAMIFCIVGASICLTEIIAAASGVQVIKIGGMYIKTLIEEDITDGMLLSGAVTGLIFCSTTIALTKLANRYFTHELAAGTPFTEAGAKELMKLGITTMAVSLGAVILARIAFVILSKTVYGVGEADIDNGSGIIVGAVMLLFSLIFKYGSEFIPQDEIL